MTITSVTTPPASPKIDDEATSPSSSPMSNSSIQSTKSAASMASAASTTNGNSLTRFYNDNCYFLIPMLGWFLFSALLSSYNKQVFGVNGMNFPCPLLLTSLHFFCQWMFAEACCALWPAAVGSARVSGMTWREFNDVSIPCGLVTAADIGLSNLSWITLSLTFYTMVKSCSPIFVLLWAYLFGITRITWELVGVIALITLGELITVTGEVKEDGKGFQWTGFLMCVSATVLSGARWTLVQLKLQSLNPPLKTTIVTMRLLAPSMFVSLFIVSLAIEQPWYRLQVDFMGSLQLAALALFGAVFAISMIMCEFYLILKANALLLAVGGVAKEVTTIFVGIIFFGDRFTKRSFLGCCVIFAGVVWYKFTFKKEKERDAKERMAQQEAGAGNHHHDDNASLSTQTTTQSKEEKRGLLQSSSSMSSTGLRLSASHLSRHESGGGDDKHELLRRSSPPPDDGWVLTNDFDDGGIELGHSKSATSPPTSIHGQSSNDHDDATGPQFKIV